MRYFFETGGCITVHSQHDRRGTNERGRHKHYVIVNLRDSADAESNDTDTYKRSMSDRRVGMAASELTDVHDPTVGDPTDETAISETLDEQSERKTAPPTDEVS